MPSTHRAAQGDAERVLAVFALMRMPAAAGRRRAARLGCVTCSDTRIWRDKRQRCDTLVSAAISNGRPDVTDDDPERTPVREAADYIASLTEELATLAARNRLEILSYLLEMACMEARDVASRESEPRRWRRGARSVEAP